MIRISLSEADQKAFWVVLSRVGLTLRGLNPINLSRKKEYIPIIIWYVIQTVVKMSDHMVQCYRLISVKFTIGDRLSLIVYGPYARVIIWGPDSGLLRVIWNVYYP